jgi:glycosyltransferase involved in cell wall biosynthesis
MEVAADTAAVMVTHNGGRFIRPQCESIFRQSVLPAVLAVVDDASTDGTLDVLREIGRTAPVPMDISVVDSSAVGNVKTRVAMNVSRGLAAVGGYDFVLLSDQDDEWLETRLASQRAAYRGKPGALLVAGDGLLIDEAGAPTGGSLHEIFPVPSGWTELDAAGRMRAALRRSFVTGAASALSAEMVRQMMPIPRGWLHDRWATLVAAARDGLLIQDEPVIKYRIHDLQVVGRRQALTGEGKPRWRQVLDRGSSPLEAASRARDIVGRLKPIAADPKTRSELSWRAVLSSALEVA